MEIVAGTAHGVVLRSPDNADIRPTAVRARRAFFDSLGDVNGIVFADFCAGSGAMGLEAASRGAGSVVFVEKSQGSISIIRKNCAAVQRAGVDTEFEIIRAELPMMSARLLTLPQPDVIFADPPYADSMKILQELTANDVFRKYAENAVLYWELPDKDFQLMPPSAPWRITAIRDYGAARFLVLKCEK